MPARLLRYLWVSPNSLVGLSLALLALPGGRLGVRAGVCEACGGWLPGLMGRKVQAVTLGHVILARNAAQLERWREHELVHVRQYELYGPGFLPAYLLLAIWQGLRGRHPYRDHPLERQAGL